MLKVCKDYKHINKDPVDKVAQFRGANSQNYWQKTTLQKFLLFCFTLALLGCEIPFKLHTANCNDLVTAQFLIYYAFQPLQKSTFLLLERKTERKKKPSGHTYIFVTAMLAMLAFGSLFSCRRIPFGNFSSCLVYHNKKRRFCKFTKSTEIGGSSSAGQHHHPSLLSSSSSTSQLSSSSLS